MRPDERSPRLGPNEPLIGHEGSRSRLETPCLVLNRAVLSENLVIGARLARHGKKKLRPHLKAHKTAKIAALQRDLGASGFCVASVGEAAIFAELGFNDLLVTSTYATEGKMMRMLSLIDRGCRAISVIDNVDVGRRLARMAAERSLTVEVMIDVRMKRPRSGCATPSDARDIAKLVEACSNLTLTGLQVYAGHLSHAWRLEDRRQGWAEAQGRTSDFLAAVQEVCPRELILSGGSTGNAMWDVEDPTLSEVQWGSYALMDVEYLLVEPIESVWSFQPALLVATSVVSTNAQDVVTLDFGFKHVISRYGLHPQVHRGAPSGTDVQATSDEHGSLALPPSAIDLAAHVELVVPHCDPTMNLYDLVHVVDGDILVDIWPIDARGAF